MFYSVLGIFSYCLIFGFVDQSKLGWIEPEWLLKSINNAFYLKILALQEPC